MPSFKDIEGIQYNLKKTPRRYFVEVMNSFSRLLSSLVLGNGSLSISSYLYKMDSKWTKVMDYLYSFVEKEHCMKSYYYDLAKARKLITTHEESFRHGFPHCSACSTCLLSVNCNLYNRTTIGKIKDD